MKKGLIWTFVIIVIGILTALFIYKSNQNILFELDNEYYNRGEFIEKNSEEVNSLINNNSSFILFVYNNYCSLKVPCDEIFSEVFNKYNIDALKIKFELFKNTSLYNDVKYAPSVILISNGKIVKYLDANSNKDLDRYQITDEFEKWLKKYVNLKREN